MLHRLIDRLDTFCYHHTWVPTWMRIRVGRLWEWTFRHKTWTAVGDDAEPGAVEVPCEWEPEAVEVPCEWDSDGTPVDWIRLSRTHPRGDICEQGCVIHNRTDHHMRHWPLLWRGDRKIFERICPHGIGHPDPDQVPYWRATDQMYEAVHGCDFCCRAVEA